MITQFFSVYIIHFNAFVQVHSQVRGLDGCVVQWSACDLKIVSLILTHSTFLVRVATLLSRTMEWLVRGRLLITFNHSQVISGYKFNIMFGRDKNLISSSSSSSSHSIHLPTTMAANLTTRSCGQCPWSNSGSSFSSR